MQNTLEKFGVSNFLVTFALAITKHAFAEIAQLVERNLAKVEVAGPSPVFRSRQTSDNQWIIARFSFSAMCYRCPLCNTKCLEIAVCDTECDT